MKGKWRKTIAAMTAVAMTAGLCACGNTQNTQGSESMAPTEKSSEAGSGQAADGEGISESSPYYGKGYDLADTENIVLYVLGDRPADMDRVLDEVNQKYLLPNLNSTLEVNFLNWSDYQTKYSLILAGGEDVDLMYTSSWCYYNEESGKGAFRELDDDFIQKYFPYTYAEQPEVSWEQAKIGGKIYGVPKGAATFSNYDFIAVRQDLIDKYNLTMPKDWETFKQYLYELADIQKETGVIPLNTNANRNQTTKLYMQTQGYYNFVEGYDYIYQSHGKDELPGWDAITYLYTSDLYEQYVKEMAEMAEAGIWSKDAINDTNDSTAYFENGTSGAIAWNRAVIDAGQKLEAAGLGTFAACDVSPDIHMARGLYNGDMIAIATNSKHPERAALVLDYMKSDVDLNRTLLGGIRGVHWDLNDQGQRQVLDEASNYSWNSWAWALNRADEPVLEGTDERELAIEQGIESRELHPVAAGFTFDSTPVSTELSVVNSIVDEYEMSFALGIYGSNTEAKLQEFRDKLNAAGLDKVTEEMKKQYDAFAAEHQ